MILTSMRPFKFYLLFSIFFFLFSQTALAQTTPQSQNAQLQQERQLIEEETIISLKKTEELSEERKKKGKIYAFDYGGWITSYYWNLHNLDNNSGRDEWTSDIFLQDLRVWVRAELYRTISSYFRLELYQLEKETSIDYTGTTDGLYGPKIDMLYLKADLMPRFKIPAEATIGRQYFKLGRGITYSDVHDGVLAKGNIGPDWIVQGFVSRNKPHDHNLDYSAPNYKRDHRRIFLGNEIAYKGIENHVIYAYSLFQRDLSQEQPEDGVQNYHYNSQYYGLGASGMPANRLKYWVEIIKENGHSYTDARRLYHRKSSIDAWAYNAGTKYSFDSPIAPILELETAYGSGDRDRRSVTNAFGGNIFKDDNNFSYYGSYYAGYAFAPRLSNLFIHKAAFSLQPLKSLKIEHVDNIAIGAKYYLYHKDRSAGGIYDTEATIKKKFVGQEVDLYFYWKMYHNLYYSMRYGIFFPGTAYPDETDDWSRYFLARLTMTF